MITKLSKTVLAALVLLACLSSCIREDMSDCRSINYLLLSYVGDGEEEIFNDMIDKVDIYIFDSDEKLVENYTLPEADVKARKTLLPPLDAGDYRIVCLGNTYHTDVKGLPVKAIGENIIFSDKDYTEGKTVSGNDPLYFSSLVYEIEPFDAMLPEDKVETAEFRCSHYDVVIEVAGVPDAKNLPLLKMSGLLPSTDFLNVACGQEVTYEPKTAYNAEKTLMSASFNIMRHKAHEKTDITVENSAGVVLAKVNLAEFLAANSDKIDVSKQEVLIPVRIEFKSGNVSIKLPEWFIEDVKPEF